MTLDTLPTGLQARIVELTGDDPVTVRLGEMGLLLGEPIEVLGMAPLRDPMAILIRGSRLALRRRDAARIRVEPVAVNPTQRAAAAS
jgi:ferrous iron transport protein A